MEQRTRVIRVPVLSPNPDQLELLPVVKPERVEGESIQERFERFHAANPAVYRNLRRLAFAAKGRGFRRIGIEMLYAVLRWEYAGLRTTDATSEFKLNDHYTSRYARLLMEREAELEGLFETRRLRTG